MDKQKKKSKFLVKNLSHNFVRHVAATYLAKPGAPLAVTARLFRISDRAVSNILWRGIAENIVSDEYANAIVDKIVYCYEKGKNQRLIRWEKALTLREELKQKEAKIQKIQLLKSQIEHFDDYFIEGDEGAPSKEDLIQELSNLESQI